MTRVGSVTMSIVKSISLVTLFLFSHLLFCSTATPSQCINEFKIISLIIVLLGFVFYNTGVVMKKKKHDDKMRKLALQLAERERELAEMDALEGDQKILEKKEVVLTVAAEEGEGKAPEKGELVEVKKEEV